MIGIDNRESKGCNEPIQVAVKMSSTRNDLNVVVDGSVERDHKEGEHSHSD